jgi:hypothetical protein
MPKRTIQARITQAQENKGDWDYEDPKLPRAVINNLEGQLP